MFYRRVINLYIRIYYKSYEALRCQVIVVMTKIIMINTNHSFGELSKTFHNNEAMILIMHFNKELST